MTVREVSFALIITHNRPGELERLVSMVGPEVSLVVIIDNASEPPVCERAPELCRAARTTVEVIRDEEQPPNLYRLWNIGLDYIAELAQRDGLTVWDVGVFNDDATTPHGWFERTATALRESSAVIATTPAHQCISTPLLRLSPDNNLSLRMCPWAFITKGEAWLRADEDYGWWYGDTDFERRARLSGGVLLLPGEIPGNTCANSTTVGALAEQAGRDRETFGRKWGSVPW